MIKQALENNYDLQTAVARIEESRALVGVAASEFYLSDAEWNAPH